MTFSKNNIPMLGATVGLRRAHHDDIIAQQPKLPWFEILTENYLNRGGAVRQELDTIAERYPMATHGIAMSVGGTDPLDAAHIAAVKKLNRQIDARWTSEHLSFNSAEHTNLSGLIPLPFTSEAVDNVAARVHRIQQDLELPFLLENVTYYMTISQREMSELEFLQAVLDRADCGLLLDVTNVHINARNNGYDAEAFIRALPPERIAQVHLAGFNEPEEGALIKDTHDSPVNPAIWDLYRLTLDHVGPVNTIIERDSNIPAFDELLAESRQAQTILDEFTEA